MLTRWRNLRRAITPRLVNLATGELLDKDPGKFNQAQALKDPQQSIALDASQDPAGD